MRSKIKRGLKNWFNGLLITLLGLVILGVLAGAAFGIFGVGHYYANHRYDDQFKIWVDDNPALSFEEAAQLGERLNKIVQKVERAGWRPESGKSQLMYWTAELIPQYSYNGAVSETKLIDHAQFHFWYEGFAHNHVGGRSDCNKTVRINERYMNPISSWYQAETWPMVLAHELAHAQQGIVVCEHYTSERLENTAQLVAWEIMANLANKGNAAAAFVLVREMRSIALSAADAIDPQRGDQLFEQLFGHDAARVARREASDRYWSADPEFLQELLRKYRLEPLTLLLAYRQHGEISHLALDNETKSLVMDDLYYFLAHAEELVDAYLAEL